MFFQQAFRATASPLGRLKGASGQARNPYLLHGYRSGGCDIAGLGKASGQRTLADVTSEGVRNRRVHEVPL